MEYKRNKSGEYFLRIDKGEELFDTISKFCKKENIVSGAFHGIGACSNAILSVYLPDKKIFKEHILSGILELISTMGNVTLDKNGLLVHAHASFSYLEDNKIIYTAGHLKSTIISYTGEFIFIPSDFEIRRKPDKEMNIDIWDFCNE